MTQTTLSRRDFLLGGGVLAAASALAACSGTSDLALSPAADGDKTGMATPAPANGETPATSPPAPGPTSTPVATPQPDDDALLRHTLQRMTFGVTEQMLADARVMGLDGWLDYQLDAEAIDDSEIEAIVGRYPVSGMTLADFEALIPDGTGEIGQHLGEFVLATALRMAWSPKQVFEMMVDFWSNHFNIYLRDGQLTGVLKIYDDRDVIRPHALGQFGELLHASAKSPAMLVYLDNATSTAEGPNENYARELLELHTLGVDGGYSYDDIVAAARTLTGWSVGRPRDGNFGQFMFRQRLHDDGAKAVYGLAIPAGSGLAGGERLLEHLAAQDATARFLSTKLATRFVRDDPPAALVDELAASFSSSGGDIRAWLRTLVQSPAFAASKGQKLRRPLEFVLALLRVTEASISATPRGLMRAVQLLGQTPFGWAPPNGYPDVAGYWLNTSGMLNRWNFAMLTAGNQLRDVQVPLARLTADAGSASDVVDLLSLRFLGEALPNDARDVLVSFASDGPLDDLRRSAVAGLILGSPYFQVR